MMLSANPPTQIGMRIFCNQCRILLFLFRLSKCRAVFGYEGKSYDLKVVETSDGDLEELVDEMNGGKILYAVIRIKDPNTQLHKTVWINWSGEGVPSSVKGACANHVATITKFFRSTHVTINARSEDDLDEATILAKVAKSSGEINQLLLGLIENPSHYTGFFAKYVLPIRVMVALFVVVIMLSNHCYLYLCLSFRLRFRFR